MLLVFGFLTEQASWIHRIFKIWRHYKKKFKNSNSAKIWRSRPILIKFSIKHHSVLVNLRTKFQLDKSKFAWVRQFWENSRKIQKIERFEFFKSDSSFVISNPENPYIPFFPNKFGIFFLIFLSFWIRNLKFLKSDSIFIISDPKNPFPIFYPSFWTCESDRRFVITALRNPWI